MAIFLGIDHVQLAAPIGSEATARAFFSGILGMPEITKPASLAGRGGVWFQCGAQELHIGVQSPFVPALKAHPAFAVSNLKKFVADLENAGVEIECPPALPNADRVFVSDPFGNRIELIEQK